MLDILVVDDEALARQRLVRFVSDLGYELCGEASHAAEALALIEAQDPAIVLLDIEMPGETGLQLAEKISGLENPPAVIFVTAYDQYALDAFNTFAAGYLLKPVNREKLQHALEKAQTVNKAQLTQLEQSSGSKTQASSQHITASSHRGVDLIAVDSIRCLLADSKYITVIGTGGESLVDGTLKQFEAEFSDVFARVHRNALVSIRHIEGLERAIEGHYTIRLKDTDARPIVSRRYTSKVKALLNSL
jgi:two-component system response regulator AlgR